MTPAGAPHTLAPADLGSAIALDLGTARTKLSYGKRAVLIDEPTLLSRGPDGTVRAGWAAWVAGCEHSDHTVLHTPIQHALVADPAGCVDFLRELLARAHRGGRGPVALAIPAAATPSEADVLRATVQAALGGPVLPVDTLVAGAIGAGLSISDPAGVLVCDVGVGIVEIGVVNSRPARPPVLIARASADLGVRDYEDNPIRFLGTVRDALRSVLAQVPDPSAVLRRGRWLHLIGGGAVVSGLAEDVTAALNVGVAVPVDPRHAVINGLLRSVTKPP